MISGSNLMKSLDAHGSPGATSPPQFRSRESRSNVARDGGHPIRSENSDNTKLQDFLIIAKEIRPVICIPILLYNQNSSEVYSSRTVVIGLLHSRVRIGLVGDGADIRTGHHRPGDPTLPNLLEVRRAILGTIPSLRAKCRCVGTDDVPGRPPESGDHGTGRSPRLPFDSG